jgi:hypothetical protein
MTALVLDVATSERAQATRRTLATSVPALDRILGGFPAGQVTLLDSGSDFVYHLLSLLCVQNVLAFDGATVFVDGGNSIDPYAMAAMAKRARLRRQDILSRVHVARAFTCHQMAALVVDGLPKRVEATDATLVVLSCLPTLFLDEDVDAGEAHQLFLRSVRRVQEVTKRHDTITVVTNVGLGMLHRRKGIRRVLYDGADRIVRFLQRGGDLVVDLPAEGVRIPYRPVTPSQATLDDFVDPRPRIVALAAAPQPKAVRGMERLRLAW